MLHDVVRFLEGSLLVRKVFRRNGYQGPDGNGNEDYHLELVKEHEGERALAVRDLSVERESVEKLGELLHEGYFGDPEDLWSVVKMMLDVFKKLFKAHENYPSFSIVSRHSRSS